MLYGSRLSLFLFLFILGTATCVAQWKQKSFIIGADFNPAPSSFSYADSAKYIDEIEMAKNAYINLFMGYTNTGRYTDDKYIAYQLKTIAQYGISMLYRIPSNFSLDNESNVFDFTANLDSVDRKALYGYNIQDEPRTDNLTDVNNWIVSIHEKDPGILGYVNLLPLYGFKSKTEYDKYLNDFLENSHTMNFPLGLVSYDFYPFVYGNIRPDYFYNLSIIRKMAGTRPLWAYIQSVQHGIYDDPTPYELYFQVFCPLAYGAKGYIYYTYETIPYSPNYTYGDAIIARNGAPSAKYDVISELNKFVDEIVAPIIMNSKFLGAYHVSNHPYLQYIPSNELVNNEMPVLAQVGNENILSGIFQSNSEKSDFNILFVNKEDDFQKNVPISIRGNHVGRIMVSRRLADNNGQSPVFKFAESLYDASSNLTRLVLDFAPGELRVIKIRNDFDPYEKVIYPLKFDMTVYPNPIVSNCKLVYSLSKSTNISINIYSLDGRLRQSLLPMVHLDPGKYYLYFDRPKLPKGLYVVSLLANGTFYGSKKIVLN